MTSDRLHDRGHDDAIHHEQAYVDMLFSRLDAEVATARRRLADVSRNLDPANPKAEALVQRETEYHQLGAKLDRLNLAQIGLVFGRIDIAAPGDNPVPGNPELDRRYIGRMGLDDRADSYRTLLVDWRAPMARPFYLATTAHPEGVTLRRHIRTNGRMVTDVSDEHVGAAPEDAAQQEDWLGVAGETALVAALNQPRTGRMASIVETIQREQDEIIRDNTRGVMVVEGGPGTGKTAVALHRVAYLLYTWREQLARTGVLIVGPNSTFLDYISHVLPELGETGVVLSTVSQLYPGVAAPFAPTLREDPLTREIKGSAEMATILAEAVRDRQELPGAPLTLRTGSLSLTVDQDMVRRARTRARRSRRPHNQARAVFRDALLDLLAAQLAETIGADPLGGKNLLSAADVDQLHDDLDAEPDVDLIVEELWPALTPEQLAQGLFTDAQPIARAAHDYDEETRAALLRHQPGWADSDAALLDELAELLGPLPPSARPDADGTPSPDGADDAAEILEAQETLDILEGSQATDNDDDAFDAEYLSAHDVIDAAGLAARQETRDDRSTAQRARADRTWAYGHVVVDEAQELSPMEWRMVFRRCPNRWMTLVGDPAQTSAPAGVDSWEAALSPFVGSRLRTHRLTINYRTPAEVTAYANDILARIDPQATPAQAIRESGHPVRTLPAGAPVPTPADGRPVTVINAANVASIKGLEFDHVLVDAPGDIVSASPQGLQDLYVAVTRATQSLTIRG